MAQCRYFLWLAVLVLGTLCITSECKAPQKKWLIIVFAAADNNLRDYIAKNLRQMAQWGSNDNFYIVVHVDIRLMGQKKTTRRYVIEKNNPVILEMREKNPMNSGDPETLISACRWAIQEYPADHHMLIFWNHGTGIIDPYGRRHIDTDKLFFYNPTTNNYELDRSIGFLDLIETDDPKGICWDDTTGDYLTNQKLEFALNEIVIKQLDGKKFDIISFDACLMSMVEIAEITKRYAHFQVSSEEVEPGLGYKYDEVLSCFAHSAPDPRSFAIHIVKSFAKAYQPFGNHPGFADFTQSAIDLSYMETLEENINAISQLFIQGITSSQGAIYKNIIALSRNKKFVTFFNEPTYIDIRHLFSNFSKNLKTSSVASSPLGIALQKALEEAEATLKKAIICSVSGSNLPNASGLSIFFPEKKIHPSYKKTNWAKNNWINFLSTYLLAGQ